MQNIDFYKEAETRFIQWAEGNTDIIAAFVAGSRARIDHPADELSDLDIMIYTTNPEFYLSNPNWLGNMGKLLSYIPFQNSGGGLEWLTLYEGGYQVDYVIDYSALLTESINKSSIPEWFNRGARILVDKNNVCAPLIAKNFTAPSTYPVNAEQFEQNVNTFWFLAIYLAKQVLRNELWTVKARDHDIKQLLLQMIEWHEKVKHGNDYDTWHAGRFIYEWVSDDTYSELQKVYAHFDKAGSWQALLNTIRLYQRLSHDVANRENYSYPGALEENIIAWINAHDPEDGGTPLADKA